MWKALGDYRGPRTVRAFYRYSEQAVRERRELEAYRLYMTESARLSAQGKYIDSGYLDLFREPRPQESAEQIVDRVIEMAGLEVMEHEPAGSDGEDRGR